MAHAGGRPLVFESVEILEKQIKEYFELCDAINEPYTITGLADHLGVTRQTLLNYTNKDTEFFATIKKAKTKIERQYEMRALRGEYNSAVAIFLMKNNFGYVDRQEQEVVVQEKSKAERLSDTLFSEDE